MFNLKNLFTAILFGVIFFANLTASAENLEQEKTVWVLLNNLRAKYGVASVSWNSNSDLQTAARIRAQEISQKFSHDRPDGSSCFTVLRQTGVKYRACGENIAMGTNLGAERAMELWKNSPGHFQNMVDEKFKEVGIVSFRAGENVYWVQLFIK